MKFSAATAGRITAVVLILIAAGVLMYAAGFKTLLTDPLGPMFFPRAMALLLLAGALVLLWRSLGKTPSPTGIHQREDATAAVAEDKAGRIEPAVNGTLPARGYVVWLLPLLTFLYIPVLALTGFIPATFLMLMALAVLMPSGRPSLFKPAPDWRGLLLIAVISLVISLAIYLLFQTLLGVPLP